MLSAKGAIGVLPVDASQHCCSIACQRFNQLVHAISYRLYPIYMK